MPKIITRRELKSLFADYGRRAVFATIVAKTVCRPAKGVKQRLVKRATVNGLFGPRDNEKPRVWGSRVMGTGLVTHKGHDYVEMLVQHVNATYHDAESDCIIEGGENLVRQRLDGETLRDYCLDNITEVRANKEVYHVVS